MPDAQVTGDVAAAADYLRARPDGNGKVGVIVQVYENAGHAFFSTDRPKYRTAAALAGWQRIVSWFSRHLSADPAAAGTP